MGLGDKIFPHLRQLAAIEGLDSSTWDGLMRDTTVEELETMIKSAEGQKAPGYDGVTIDLIKLLIEEPGPLRELLTTLINVAFRTGASLPSWRKAVITMIPNKKEDGKWTDTCAAYPCFRNSGKWRPKSLLPA